MEGQHSLVKVVAAQTDDVLQHLVAVAALVLDVVDGEDALGVIQLRDAVLVLQQVDGHQGGLPVVAVDDIRPPVQLSGGLDHSPGEVGEPLAVVKVAVHLPALEVVLVVHKPVGDPIPLQLENAAVHLPPGQGDVEVLQEGHLTAPLPADAFIQGEDHLHLVAGLGQCLGQRTSHIGQTAVLMKGTASEAANKIFMLKPLSPNYLQTRPPGQRDRNCTATPAGN